MQKCNLVLSGGGVRSYAHLGVYRYLCEQNIEINEITAVSGGAIIAPFIFVKREVDKLIKLFKNAKLQNLLFPFWFVPNKFEFLFIEPRTIKLGEWVEKQFNEDELIQIHSTDKLHIMATKNPLCSIQAVYTDMLTITDLKNSIAASSAISGIFKEHFVNDCTYIDGGHWTNCPIFFDFKNKSLPVVAVNLGYPGLLEENEGRISKIIKGLEIGSYARVREDIKRWEFEKNCGSRKDLFVINPPVWNIRSLDFNLKEWQIHDMIESGYKAAKYVLSNVDAYNSTHLQ